MSHFSAESGDLCFFADACRKRTTRTENSDVLLNVNHVETVN